jgi:F-type H+-transporting ATPase subunit alpha
LESDLFFAGVRPAINVGISASRVGGKAQTKAMKKVAGSLRLHLAQYRELAAFAEFGSELDDATKSQLNRGAKMVEILKQDKFEPCPLERQVMIIYVGTKGFLDKIDNKQIARFESEFNEFVDREYPEIPKTISDTKDLSEDIMKKLDVAAEKFVNEFQQNNDRR